MHRVLGSDVVIVLCSLMIVNGAVHTRHDCLRAYIQHATVDDGEHVEDGSVRELGEGQGDAVEPLLCQPNDVACDGAFLE